MLEGSLKSEADRLLSMISRRKSEILGHDASKYTISTSNSRADRQGGLMLFAVGGKKIFRCEISPSKHSCTHTHTHHNIYFKRITQ